MRENNLPCSLKDFSETVEAIYDTVIQPDRWRDAVQKICALCDSPLGSIGVFNLSSGENIKLYDYGYSPEYWFHYQAYANEHPIMPAVHLMQAGEVITIAAVCSDEDFFGSRIYKDFLEPRGQFDLIGLLALRTGERLGYLHACREIIHPRYGQNEIEIFNMLSKHVCRAMHISDLFDLRKIEIASLQQTLDSLAVGIYLCDQDGQVIFMNHVAQAQIESNDAIALYHHRITARDSDAAQMFTTAFFDAVRNEANITQQAPSISFPNRQGSGLIATILPLQRGERQDAFKGFAAAAAAVFVKDPSSLPLFPGEAFAKLYGLTGAELRVALALAPEMNLEEVAGHLNIGLQTIKTHMQHIFQKTHTNRQADLIALMSRFSGPMKAD